MYAHGVRLSSYSIKIISFRHTCIQLNSCTIEMKTAHFDEEDPDVPHHFGRTCKARKSQNPRLSMFIVRHRLLILPRWLIPVKCGFCASLKQASLLTDRTHVNPSPNWDFEPIRFDRYGRLEKVLIWRGLIALKRQPLKALQSQTHLTWSML